MKIWTLLIAAVGCLTFAQKAAAQAPPTTLIYYDKAILTDTGDDQGDPIPDGTEVRILWDWNANGPDDKDPLPVAGEDAGNATFNRFEINSEKYGLKPGQFFTDPAFSVRGSMPSPPMFYLVICLEDKRLLSNVFMLRSGYSEVSISEWTVVKGECVEVE